MGEPGRKYNDEFEPQPENLYCIRNGVEMSIPYLRRVVYWHLSKMCKECKNKPICEEKGE